MPRIARAVAVGYPYHVTQRGNYRPTVFESDKDYLQYLEWLRVCSKKYSLKIWAYCLIVKKVKDWSKYLREKEDSSLVADIRQNTKTGRPCGDDGFILWLEKLLGRRLGALPWERPRKGK